MPLMIAPMACSRMPKWIFRPRVVRPASKSPAPAKVSRGLGGRGEVGRAADQPGHVLGEGVEHLAAEHRASAFPFASAGKTGRFLSQPSGSSRCCMRSISSASSGYLRLVLARTARPRPRERLAALADAVLEVIVDAVGDEELGVLGPAVDLLGQLDFFFAERFAVGLLGVLLVRRAVADVARRR